MRAFTRLSAAVLIALGSAVQAGPAPSAKDQGDPNERVCEKIGTIGSRLATKKVCATRAEWDEKRRLDREAVDQAQRAANGPCQTINTHSGAPSC
jgi:hypothetical protein